MKYSRGKSHPAIAYGVYFGLIFAKKNKGDDI